jgi:predicted lipid-binding transport protein (Tim44 family)
MSVKRVLLTGVIAALCLSLISLDVEAKRLGGGSNAGMKRAVPQQPHDASRPLPASPTAAPQQAAAPAAIPPAPAAAPKRSWMGPIAGLAAGLGIAALASHFGMGGALANGMTMILLAVGAMLLIGFVMRRFSAGNSQAQNTQFAGAGAGAGAGASYGAPAPFPQQTAPQSASPAAYTPATSAPVSNAAPLADDGFDVAGFEQIAKRVFIRLQAANDAGDQADLRRFTTPEMYGVVQQELLDRKGAKQSTEVLQLDARVIDRAEEHGQQIVSVRFWGLIREQSEAAAENFDEVWHLVRPLDGSRPAGDWAIAGIQTTA